MPKAATVEDWSGLTFANNWVIQKKLSCAEYRNIYIEQTGDTTKQIKNTHYLCYNTVCGVSTYIERTVIQRAMNANRTCLSKCKGCNGSRENCHYSVQCREKNLTKIPDRSTKMSIGDKIGNWEILDIYPSGNDSGHQMSVLCKCLYCGTQKKARLNAVLDNAAACECFKNHSIGEMMISKALENLDVSYLTEYVFDDLVGLGGGSLRYDFAIFNQENKLCGLIEFDGEQHFQDAGSYFNQNGTVQIHDKIKDDFAEKHNIPLLRVPYYEITNVQDIVANFILKLFY